MELNERALNCGVGIEDAGGKAAFPPYCTAKQVVHLAAELGTR